jgi:hypothetical protein
MKTGGSDRLDCIRDLHVLLRERYEKEVELRQLREERIKAAALIVSILNSSFRCKRKIPVYRTITHLDQSVRQQKPLYDGLYFEAMRIMDEEDNGCWGDNDG